MTEKLNLKDFRLIMFCIAISIISLIIVQKYFTQVFPDASINMDITKDEAHIVAKKFLANQGHDVEPYIHAHRFGYKEDEKEFLEFELPADEAGEILNNTNRYFWRNRWFIPEKKEEFYVKISTSGNLVEYEHKIAEDAPGDSLTQTNAINIAQFFLVGSIGIEIDEWELVESKTKKLKNRWDHEFIWKEKSFDINESSHRMTVKVQGWNVDYYKEWIKVPDTWKRKFEKIRANNSLLGSIGGFGMILTLFLIFIIILIRSRERDIRWKTAFMYAGIIGGLMLLMQLNNLPLKMYNFDNKDSYLSFISNLILIQCLLVPLGISLFFGILIAGSEPLYRDQYPHHIAFRHLFSVQGIKSKSFFNSAIIGISLTFATFAFQTIYYLVSNNLGGWSPREVPNFDRYATYIPWVGVLLGGLMPAIMEESISRMFSIPFLQKYTKSTIFAVLFSSIIWGLGHAGYPAQPFYIRVVEVSAMGIIISWVFIRYGILATLIWHFSVDAVYSAMILLRSSNLYYLTTGAICAGLVMLPLVYVIISYLKNGGFITSDHLVNALDTEIVDEQAKTKEVIEKTKFTESYKPLSSGRIKLSVGVGIIGILLYFMSSFEKSNDPIYNFNRLDKNRTEAIEMARDYLLNQGFNLEGYHSVANAENWFGSGGLLNKDQNKYVAYIMEHEGKEKLRDFLAEDKLISMGWAVRFFIPEVKREYKVWVAAKGKSTTLLDHVDYRETLSDTASIAYITKIEAVSMVREFAENSNLDLSNMELIEEETIERVNRTDYHFKFKGNNKHEDTVGEAKRTFEFKVHGNYIGNLSTRLQLPESWEREYRKRTLYDIIRVFSFFFIFIILGILGIRYLLQLIKENKPNWKFVFYFAIVLFILGLINHINYTNLLWDYGTEKPLNIFIFQVIFGSIVGLIGTSIFFSVLILAIHLAWPNFFSAFNRENRMIYLKDAFVAFLFTIGIWNIFGFINTLITVYHPTYIRPQTFDVPWIDSYFPLLYILTEKTVFSTLVFMLFIVGIYYIYTRLIKQKGFTKLLVITIIAIPFILPAKPEILPLFMHVLKFGILILLVRYYWRYNPISFMLGAFSLEIIPSILSYYSTIHDPTYRNQVFAAIFCIGIVFLYFIKEAFYSSKAIKQ